MSSVEPPPDSLIGVLIAAIVLVALAVIALIVYLFITMGEKFK